MKIKTKILSTLLGMSLLVALVGGLAVNRQHAAEETLQLEKASKLPRNHQTGQTGSVE